LNGFASGKGTSENLAVEIDGFKLNDQAKEYATQLVKKQQGKGFFCSG